MSDIHSDRVERHRDENVYASRIERDKKGKEKYTPLPSKEDKRVLIATFFSYLKRLFDTFSPSKKLAGKVIDHQSIIENLKIFKKLFKKLGEQDLSNSSDYAAHLSEIWTVLLEDFDNIEIIERKNLSEVARFREMMDKIKNYPPDSEHRLGYYFLQQAGKDWLPFPFIEILEKLHKEHKEDAKNSTLSMWSKLIDTVITNLQSILPFKGF